MSKMIEASCVGGVVTAIGVPVPAADILSEGVAASTGFLLLDGDEAKYVPKTSPDLKTTLTKLISILGQLTTALTAIDTKVLVTSCGAGPGSTAPLPLAAANIAALSVIQSELTVLKETLR
jgi:hypothetical protein